MLVERIGGPEAQVASEIGIVWALHVALGAMIEPREDRESRDVLALPETDMLRALRALVPACGPWIGTFPAGRVFDDPAPSPPPAIAEAAATFLRGAEDAGLLRDDAAAVIRAVLEGIDHRGPFADKAGNWGVLTANNLTIAMLLVLAQIARAYENGAASPESPQAARSIERLVLEQEKHLPRPFSHLPDDIRQERHASAAV